MLRSSVPRQHLEAARVPASVAVEEVRRRSTDSNQRGSEWAHLGSNQGQPRVKRALVPSGDVSDGDFGLRWFVRTLSELGELRTPCEPVFLVRACEYCLERGDRGGVELTFDGLRQA